MTEPHETHCWEDVIDDDARAIYRFYHRKREIGPSPALLAIDLYNLAYDGGARSVRELLDRFPSSCGEHAWAAIEPTKRLFAAARAAGIPVIYTTVDPRVAQQPGGIVATQRQADGRREGSFEIWRDFPPQPGDLVIYKERASAFFGTPLSAHLVRAGIRTLILCGESTSGCVRASAVDAYSHGFGVILAEECCFDREPLTHKINLFDIHHKYGSVMKTEAVVRHLEGKGKRMREESAVGCFR